MRRYKHVSKMAENKLTMQKRKDHENRALAWTEQSLQLSEINCNSGISLAY